MRGSRAARRSSVDTAYGEILQLEPLLDAVLRAFAADAGLLHPAEGRDLRRDETGVDSDDAVLERLRHAPDASDVAAVEVRSETVRCGIGDLDRVVLAGEACDRGDRPERLLAAHRHAGSDAREDRRLEEGVAALVARAARDELRAPVECVGDVPFNFGECRLVDQRADVDAGLRAGPDLQGVHRLCQAANELVVHGVLYEDAVCRDARLSGVAV